MARRVHRRSSEPGVKAVVDGVGGAAVPTSRNGGRGARCVVALVHVYAARTHGLPIFRCPGSRSRRSARRVKWVLAEPPGSCGGSSVGGSGREFVLGSLRGLVGSIDAGERSRKAANRVIRGGSWNNDPQNARSAYRNRNKPENRNNNLGFRVARAQRARWIPRRIEPIAIRFRRYNAGQISWPA